MAAPEYFRILGKHGHCMCCTQYHQRRRIGHGQRLRGPSDRLGPGRAGARALAAENPGLLSRHRAAHRHPDHLPMVQRRLRPRHDGREAPQARVRPFQLLARRRGVPDRPPYPLYARLGRVRRRHGGADHLRPRLAVPGGLRHRGRRTAFGHADGDQHRRAPAGVRGRAAHLSACGRRGGGARAGVGRHALSRRHAARIPRMRSGE